LNPLSAVHFVSVQQTTNAEINGLKRERCLYREQYIPCTANNSLTVTTCA